MKKTSFILTAIALLSMFAPAARADFLDPPTRGSANSTYQEWNNFTSATGLNTPDVADENGSLTSATLDQTTATGFLTSGGNIYSFAAATAFDVIVPNFNLGPDGTTTVLLQIRTQGTEVAPASVTLFDGTSTLAAATSQELARTELGGTGGYLVDTAYTWTLAGNVASYLLKFAASGSSMSLDGVSVDTSYAPAAVPEPSTYMLAMLGMVGIGIYSKARRKQKLVA